MKGLVFKIYAIVAVAFIFSSCSKQVAEPLVQNPSAKDSAADILTYSIVGMNPVTSIAPLSIGIQFADTVYDPKNLASTFTLSPGATATINGVAQVSGETKNSYESNLNYTVRSKNGSVKHWIVNSTNNAYTYPWGLGNFLKQSLSNDHTTYSWYMTQANTGFYSNINCGPTSVTMAMKWADSTFSLLPVDARNYFPQNTDLWGISTIRQYLNDHSFPNTYMLLGSTAEETKQIIKSQLDQGNILILLLTIGNIRNYTGFSADPRTDRYYPDAFNHFIVAYGYKEVDSEFYFQVNDPWNFGWTNNDGTPKGKSRFYRYEDIFMGCLNINNDMVVVSKKG